MKDKYNNPILRSIVSVNEKKEKLFLNKEILELVDQDIKFISDFLNCDDKTASVLAVMICENLTGELTSIKRIMRILGFDPFDIIKTYAKLKSLKNKGWLKLSRRRMDTAFDELTISKELINAVINNDSSKLNVRIPNNMFGTLVLLNSFIKGNLNEPCKDELPNIILNYIEELNQFSFIDNIYRCSDLLPIEKVILFWICGEFLLGKDEFDLDEILDLFIEDPFNIYLFQESVISKKNNLFNHEYICFSNSELADLKSITLGKRILEELDFGRQTKEKLKFKAVFCDLIDPTRISEKKLFFNPGNQASINEITQLISSENMKSLRERFKLHGLKPGLTIMLYGHPGTGKTELVKQIARIQKRNILQIDISSVKNMWVGESEKNMKRVFREYKEAMKYFEHAPILLFNEADAIFGSRKTVRSSVDQMLNAMQNILLQELEDFKGILIATTNQIDNIDEAFDRRLLYKLKFEKPDKSTMLAILQDQFPDFPFELLMKICEKQSLSGGQIQNVKKKFIVDQILFDKGESKVDLFLQYVTEETQFRSSKSKPIGFVVG